MSDVVVDQLPPDEAFALISHETRFRILEELNEADEPLAFARLRERVGMRDTGQFNYHLGKLTDRFVRKVEDDDGSAGRYKLTAAGKRVVGGVLSGGLTKTIDGETVPVGSGCLFCGEEMELAFETDRIRVQCPECGEMFTDIEVPAGVMEGHAREDAPAVVDRWLKRYIHIDEFGFCGTCDGPLSRRVLSSGDPDPPDWLTEDDGWEVAVRNECERCGDSSYSDLGAALLSHPAIVAFHHDHGIDVRETPLWEHDWLSTKTADVVEEDPLRVELSFSLDDERLVLVVDRGLTVVEEHREAV
ncbi:winged helix-turn-helix domain-containing protein [Haloarchaeobius amylolyticus]|uniref:winged helix-turn-helix domain-containing protein n=1 Tax=Haloarchaeobius amylolyticus TaxID=1198296 RepID=UPI00226D8912|nr:helix-turn-helix domain-containing protein [Haloarchaeobius amylolyticus]